MTNKVFYEWGIEEVDRATGDIIEVNHSDTCPGIPDDPTLDLVLIRDTADMLDGEPHDLVNRQWAYVENGKLPAEFDGGAVVPKRFHDELAKSGAAQ